jgi:signal transduction histidine kinase/CheY-like chemotaxis protein
MGVDITERKQAEEHQKLTAQILELLNQSTEKTDVIRDILLLIHEFTGFEAVGIRLQEGEDFPYYETIGFPSHFVEAERYLCARNQDGETMQDSTGNPLLECICGNVIRGSTDPSLPFFTEGGSFWTNSTTDLLASTKEKDRQARTRNRCNSAGYESVALIPLHSGDKTIGLLQLNDRCKGRFTPEMIHYFEGIGASIGISLERKITEEELRRHRDHLEELVKARTAELVIAKETADEARIAAEAASRAKSEFLANMSHELRTPLNAVMGYAQLLKREKNLTAKQQDQLNTIYSSGQHLVTLISDLLDLARIEVQKMEVEMNTFNLPALLHNILDASRLKAEERSLFVRYEALSPIPAIVRGDERKLRQVLLNLLTNAVKYTKLGGVTLRVNARSTGVPEYRSTGKESDRRIIPTLQHSNTPTLLSFQVEDTGIGIPEEQLEAIFEPFTQMKGAGRPSEGAGLGLAICRRLIELMGGRLSVDSEVGKGSTFTVELALEVVEGVGVAAKAPEKTVIGYQGARKRLLIVDDNITNLAMLVSTLEPLGFEIETADSGEEALSKAAAIPPDLILLDLLMSGMDGDEVLRRIRRTEGLEHVNVIGVSAAIADKARTERFAAACDGFLAKPVDMKELQEQLKEHLWIGWIEEEAEAAVIPPELPSDETGKPEKWPLQAIVDDLLEKANWGDFTRLERILDRLEAEDQEYKGFCDKIRAYSKRFDDDAIIDYLS